MKYSMWFFGVAAIYIAPHMPNLAAIGLGLDVEPTPHNA
jgi:hypothetical protein